MFLVSPVASEGPNSVVLLISSLANLEAPNGISPVLWDRDVISGEGCDATGTSSLLNDPSIEFDRGRCPLFVAAPPRREFCEPLLDFLVRLRLGRVPSPKGFSPLNTDLASTVSLLVAGSLRGVQNAGKLPT